MNPLAWALVWFLLGSDFAYAPTHPSYGFGSAEYHERMLARCLSGSMIVVGKRLFQCIPAGFES